MYGLEGGLSIGENDASEETQSTIKYGHCKGGGDLLAPDMKIAHLLHTKFGQNSCLWRVQGHYLQTFARLTNIYMAYKFSIIRIL